MVSVLRLVAVVLVAALFLSACGKPMTRKEIAAEVGCTGLQKPPAALQPSAKEKTKSGVVDVTWCKKGTKQVLIARYKDNDSRDEAAAEGAKAMSEDESEDFKKYFKKIGEGDSWLAYQVDFQRLISDAFKDAFDETPAHQ